MYYHNYWYENILKKIIAPVSVIVFVLLLPLISQAALSAPTLQLPSSQCGPNSVPYVALQWSAVTGATDYDIYKNGSPIPIASTPDIFFSDSNVSATLSYSYTVRARNATESSIPSNQEQILVERCGPEIQQPPDILCAADGPQITLNWNSLADNPEYQVFRDDQGSPISPRITSTTFTDSTADGAKDYSYTVRAYWASSQKDSDPLPVITPACQPIWLNLGKNCTGPSGARTTLSWNSLRGATEYQILRNGALHTSVGLATSYTDDSVQQLQNYSYKVRVKYGQINSAESEQRDITPDRCQPILTTQAICDSSNNASVILRWTETIGALWYRIIKDDILTGQQVQAPERIFTDGDVTEDGSRAYNYQISPIDGFEPNNFKSNTESATPNCQNPGPPAPSPQLDVAPFCDGSNSKLRLTWTPSNNTNLYRIEKTGFDPQNVPASETSFEDGVIQTGDTYTYRVVAVGNLGLTAASGYVTKTAVSCTGPDVPTLNLPVPICVNGNPAIELAWKSTINTNKYEIWRNGSKIDEVQQPASPPPSITYRDTIGLARQQPYTYEIKAVGPGGTNSSGLSQPVTTYDCRPPGPFDLSISNQSCSLTVVTVTLSWTSSQNAEYYDIYRKLRTDAAFGASPIATLPATQITYNNTNLPQNTSYDYYVMARSSGGNEPSDLEQITTLICPPTSPQLTVAPRCQANTSVFELNWIDASQVNSSNYAIRRDSDPNPIANISPPLTTYTDTNDGLGFQTNEQRSYTVTAEGPGGSASSVSQPGTALACRLPGQPTARLRQSCSGTTLSAIIEWDPTSDTDSYTILRDNQIIRTGLTGNSYTDPGLSPDTVYTYIVRSVGPAGSTDSEPKDIRTVGCPPPIPILTTTSACIDTQPAINLSWDFIPNLAAGYSFNNNANDASLNRNDGVLTNGPLWTVGQYESALQFDGSNDYVQVGARPTLIMSTAITIEAWIYPTGIGSGGANGGVIISKEGEYIIARFGDGTIRYAIRNTSPGWNWRSTNYVAPLNTWTHIAFTYSAADGRIKFYANGVEVYNLAASGNITDADTSRNDFRIGGRQNPSSSQYFAGKVDDVRVYSRALTAAEVTSDTNTPVFSLNEITEYQIWRDGVKINTVFPPTTSYQDADPSFIPGQRYDYEVVAVTAGGSSRSNTARETARSDCAPQTNPVITDLEPLCSGSNPQVKIDWLASSNTNSYEVHRSPDGVNFTRLTTITSTSTLVSSYRYYDTYDATVNPNLTSNTPVTYKIISVTSGLERIESQPRFTTTLWCRPTTPLWSSGSPFPYCSGALSKTSLSWNYAQPRSNTQSFKIMRNGQEIKTIAATGASPISTTDDVEAGLTYTYEIVAQGPGGQATSSPSPIITGSTCAINLYDPPIAYCTATIPKPATLLTWTIEPSASYYSTYRQVDGSASFSNLQTLSNYRTNSPTTLREWLLLGPFNNNPDPSGFDIDYIDQDSNSDANESTIRPKTGELINGRVWQRGTLPTTGTNAFFDLQRAYPDGFGAQQLVVAYAFTYVVNPNPNPIDAQLRIGSNDGIKTYFNGNLVFSRHVHRLAAQDQEPPIAIQLDPGVNTIMLKIEDGPDSTNTTWGFFARITNSSGNPLFLNTITSIDSGVSDNIGANYYVTTNALATSNQVRQNPFSCAPGIPSNLIITRGCNGQEPTMALTWDAAVRAIKYQVHRGESAPSIQSIYPDGETTNTSFTDQNVLRNKEYFYQVEATGNGNGSTFSGITSDTTLDCTAPPETPLLTNNDITPLCVGADSRLQLDWPDPTPNTPRVVSYAVERSDDNGSTFTEIASRQTSDYTDGTNIIPGKTYYYRIRAIGENGDATSNPPANKAAADCTVPPAGPTLNPLDRANRTTTVSLTWIDNSNNEEGFKIYRCGVNDLGTECEPMTDPLGWLKPFRKIIGLFEALASEVIGRQTPANQTFQSDSTNENTNYYYRVTAFNAVGETQSNRRSICIPILPPGDFGISSISCGGNKVTLNWNPASSFLGGPPAYTVEWSEDSGQNYQSLAGCTDLAVTTCTTNTPQNKYLLFRVKADNNAESTICPLNDGDQTYSPSIPSNCANLPRFREIIPR